MTVSPFYLLRSDTAFFINNVANYNLAQNKKRLHMAVALFVRTHLKQVARLVLIAFLFMQTVD
ncbi:hypothetical protein IV55_GL002007 [Furfurilactobacillus siliginis]|uniref:Uncharacterized protein n=1 Tax=Furfurilactobacillus siliginis TaxID=348151 RepID=A0A0R2LA80_9LACO|nr:hypothetical protein IV55_GL002007 [Furfurilactobacillus siliginis]GEK28143.1 hypothetical protein LSI01_04540 [Furfurilactobacillus siliginis]